MVGATRPKSSIQGTIRRKIEESSTVENLLVVHAPNSYSNIYFIGTQGPKLQQIREEEKKPFHS